MRTLHTAGVFTHMPLQWHDLYQLSDYSLCMCLLVQFILSRAKNNSWLVYLALLSYNELLTHSPVIGISMNNCRPSFHVWPLQFQFSARLSNYINNISECLLICSAFTYKKGVYICCERRKVSDPSYRYHRTKSYWEGYSGYAINSMYHIMLFM